jgi:hypothetical protein
MNVQAGRYVDPVSQHLILACDESSLQIHRCHYPASDLAPPPFSSETLEKLVEVLPERYDCEGALWKNLMKFFLNVTIAKALFGGKLLKVFLNVMIAKALSC